MEAVFNELSFLPLALSPDEAKERISIFLDLLKEIRALGIKKLKVTNDFSTKEIADGYSLYNWYGDISIDREERRALATFLQSPNIPDSFTDDMLEDIDSAVLSDCNLIKVDGLLFAGLTNTLCLSFYSDLRWDKLLINIIIERTNRDNEEIVVKHASKKEHVFIYQEWKIGVKTNKPWILETIASEKKDEKNRIPTRNNPLPFCEYSDLLVQEGAGKDPSWTDYQNYISSLNSYERRIPIEDIAAKVARINQFTFNHVLTQRNTTKTKRRIIYESVRGGE